MWEAFIKENDAFRPFSLEHLYVVLAGIAFFVFLIRYARRAKPEHRVLIGAILGYTIVVVYLLVFITCDAITSGGFDPKKHLPLAMCNVCGIAFWLVLHKKNYLAYEILFFWIMSGTLAACLTPDINQAFPHYTFLAFWIIHLGLVGGAMYATMVYGMRPGFRSVIKSYVALTIYTVIVSLMNWLLSDYDANYFYTCRKPENPSPLDFFGEWPWYLIWGQFFAAAFFLFIYLPFAVYDWILIRTGRVPVVGRDRVNKEIHDGSYEEGPDARV